MIFKTRTFSYYKLEHIIYPVVGRIYVSTTINYLTALIKTPRII